MSSSTSALNPKKLITPRRIRLGLVFIVGFIALALIAIPTWEYSNSVAFCSDTCHFVHPEEPGAYQDSYHARVKCVECHMGRVDTLQAIVLKVSHFRHLPEVIFNHYERPLESKTLRPANESCERCHWPPAFHGDRVQEIKHFASDEANTPSRTFLILKTGGGERDKGLGYGIHWHIQNKVEYIAADEHKQDIRWIRTTLPDGRVVDYNDAANPLTPEERAKATIRVMDCVDCHNRAGHPFPPPERAIDDALVNGQLSRDLPFARKEMLDVLTATYADQQAALAAVDAVKARYEAAYPQVASQRAAEIDQAADTAREMIKRLVFEKPGVTWESFPNNGQHKTFAGCFRCHDGKHQSAAGESIRLHCNICHSLPLTVGAGERAPAMPVSTIQEPESHLKASFMADHRFQANQECATCHGEIQFGADNSSFCANAACHGQAWPLVDLDANFEHPISLEGKHAQAWCNDCHEGVAKPEFKCANCHTPPQNHFQATCDACHNPQGWKESAALVIAQAPKIPHTLDGRDQCLTCHGPGGGIKPAPASHNSYVNTQCQLCHKATP